MTSALGSGVLAALRAAVRGPAVVEDGHVRATPATVEAAAALLGEAARRGIPVVLAGTPPEGGLLLDRSGLDRVGPLDEAAMWIGAGAGVRLSSVEAVLRGRGLTLGPQPPSLLSRPVAAWLEGPHAGRRAEDGRLASGIAALEAALPGGALWRSRAAPRSAAGPGLTHLLLGGGGACGAILSATIKAQPIPARTEQLAVTGSAALVARLIIELSVGLAPPLEVGLRVTDGTLQATFLFASDREEAERQRGRAAARAGALGLTLGEPLGHAGGELGWEVELPRASLAAGLSALPPGSRVRLCRIAREALVAATGAGGGTALCCIAGSRLLTVPGPDGASLDGPVHPGDRPAPEEALLARIAAELRRPVATRGAP